MGLFPRFLRDRHSRTYRGRRPKPTRLKLETLETRAMVTGDILGGVPLALYSADDAGQSADSAYVASATAGDVAQAQAEEASFLMAYTIVPAFEDGTPITGAIPIGQQFYLDIYVDDLRDVDYAGVASAQLDVAYDSAKVATTGTIIPNSDKYPVPSGAPHGDATSTPGLVKNVQGSENLNGSFSYTPLGGAPLLLNRIQVTATGAGVANFQTQVSAGQPTVLASGTGAGDIGDTVVVPNDQIQLGSASVTIVGDSTQLAVTTQPAASVTVGSQFDVKVSVEDTAGQVTPSYNGNVTIQFGNNAGGGALGGTLTVAAVNGVADFSNLSIDTIASGYTLTATAAGLTSATTAAFDVVQGPAVQLSLLAAPPSTTTAGNTFDVKFEAQDSAGHLATAFNGNVTIALLGGGSGASLGGTLTVAAVGGVADFSDLSIEKAGAGYALVATADVGAAQTDAFTVTPAALSQLTVTTQPSSSVSVGVPFSFAAAGTDQYGNVVSSFNGDVTVQFGNNAGSATLGGTTTVTATNGVATFNDLSVDQLGSAYTLTANADGLGTVTSNAFNVVPIAAQQLVVQMQPPSSVTAGNPFEVKVAITDTAGHVATSFTGNVTIQIGTNSGGATLSGAPTVAAVDGIADFTGLNLDKVGTGYTLLVTAEGLTSATTSTVDVTPAAASKLAITQQPPANTSIGVPFTVKVEAQDNFGNFVPTFGGSVSIALDSNAAGATLGGTTTVDAVDGIASFTTLSLDAASAGFTLKASSGELASVTTNAFAITAVPYVVIEPGSANASDPAHMMKFTVKLQDSAGNPLAAPSAVTIQYSTVNESGDTAHPSPSQTGTGSIADNNFDFLFGSSDSNAGLAPLVIDAGDTEGTIFVPISVETAGPNLTFHVNLSSSTDGAQIDTTKAISALGTIVNDIAPPTVSIVPSVSQAEPSSTGTSMNFTVTLSAPSRDSISVNYTITGVTAVDGVDYQAPIGSGGQVVFSPLATSGTISIPLLPNPNAIGDKTFNVSLSLSPNVDNVTLDAANALSVGTILTGGSFSGAAYVDTNASGALEAGEHLLAGLTITLSGTTAEGTAVTLVQTTGADGRYSFDNVPAGTYTVTESLPSQYAAAPAHAAAGVAINGTTQFSFVMSAGGSLTNNDFVALGLQPQYITKRLFLAHN